MREKTSRAERLQTLLLCFLTYAVCGWLYETFLELFVYRWGFSNRGVLFGPWLPVYGVGGLLILWLIGPLKRRGVRLGRVDVTPLAVFLGVLVLTTVVELIASYLMEWTTGGWLWDYTRYRIQFEGRISLSASARFGVGGLVQLYVLQPPLERGITRLGARRRGVLTAALGGLFALDVLLRLL